MHTRLTMAAVGAALLFCAWRVLGLGLADRLAANDPAAALAWRDGHPEALVAAAGRDGIAAADKAALARRVLAADPLSGQGDRLLGEAAAAEGDEEQAFRMFSLAASRSPRDPRSQAWLVDRFLRQGDVEAALSHLDPLLRVEPTLIRELLPTLAALASTPQAQPMLAERLQTRPPWRSTVVRGLATGAGDVDAVAGLFEMLRTAPGGFEPGEMDAWLERLGKAGRWGQAYLIWASQLPPERLAVLGNVANGGFEFAPAGGGFGWRLPRIAGARIDRVAGAGVGGSHALRVAFEDRRVPFAHVRQLLVLPPGDYTLSGRTRIDNLRSERGLVWTVSCAGDHGPPLVDTAPLRGHADWRDFSADFSVPANCGGQWLILRLPARIPAEQRIGGQIWFDDIRIRRRATD